MRRCEFSGDGSRSSSNDSDSGSTSISSNKNNKSSSRTVESRANGFRGNTDTSAASSKGAISIEWAMTKVSGRALQ